MFGVAVLLVLGSGFFHSVWNLYTKKSLNKNVFLWFCQLVAVVVFLPWTIVAWDSSEVTWAGLGVILASMLLHGLYVVLLAAAYSAGDLSQVYPIMRGTSPLLVPLLAVTFLHERLSVIGWTGVAVIVASIALASNVGLRRDARASAKAPLLAFAVGVCIAIYIIVDKVALDYVPPVVLNQATNVGNLLLLSWATFRSGDIRSEWKANGKYMLLGGVIAPGGYLLFLFALSLAPVAQLAPMREIGTVFGTIMGIFLLKEAQGTRRIAASVMITVGIILLGIGG